MPVLGLAQNNSETAATYGKTLFNPTGDYDLAAIAGNPEILAVNPHASASVINLEKAIAQGAE